MENHEYDKLKQELDQNSTWPLKYMFKFIAPNQDDKVKQVADLMPCKDDVKYKNTKNLKYVSITCVATMPSSDSIIEVMQKVSKIEGVISL